MNAKTIEIPELSVVALVGVSGSGKSTFGRRHFKPTEVLSSDYFRALVSDDENNQNVTRQAFDALYYVAGKRLELGLLTVIDATNVQKDARAAVLRLAKEQNCHAVAIVLDIQESVCRQRNAKRSDRNFGGHVIKNQSDQLRRSVKVLEKEGFRYVHIIKNEEDAAGVQIVRVPLWNNKKNEDGPFDIIGDIHGCYDELCILLEKLGYSVDRENCAAAPPAGRKAVFLGDLCDRGPKNIEVLRLVMNMVKAGTAYCTLGNHEARLLKKLRGADIKPTHGLDTTLKQLDLQSGDFVSQVKTFIDALISHYVFDGGKLVAAHAGIKEAYQGRASRLVRDFCLYGQTNGETDEYGLPVRLPWAGDYRGKAVVVYGHTPAPGVVAANNTYCIDTGCVFGGKLTAFKYPEKELVQTDAARQYYAPAKPFLDAPDEDYDLLSIEDVQGQRHIATSLRGNIKIKAENAAAALEVMSRFAADPRWLVYLPPTMSPCETSPLSDYLEHPAEAFIYYKKRGISKVVCEKKHMGSRAVIVMCKDKEAAARRFRVNDGSCGIIYTKAGRHFFDEPETEAALLGRLQKTLSGSGFWDSFQTDWVCLDAELMPWSAKAFKLLEEQYAPVGRAGGIGLAAAAAAIKNAERALGQNAKAAQGLDLPALAERYQARANAISLYAQAYRRYCWDVNSLDDYRIAPFHILATEGNVYSGNNHLWHMENIARFMTAADPVFMATEHLSVDLSCETSAAAAIKWWEDLTNAGGEGMVVKPYDFIAYKGAELLQPAVKCRGREYLRIIYGAEYLLDGNLERLKSRSLSRKRALAISEFALGMEALRRFTGGEPLHRVHECVFGVLAMESEPVDPRL
ncbi:MAG: polynucleotide kinase-phosphatase [Spirochaetes bacterium]|nr:polynucleotide kinase-phosphatase [Spirochaetota bacterium]